MKKVRVWDLPTRVFHWSLVVGFAGLVITGEVGGDAMVWHFRLGYTVLSLLLFRVIWGVVGGYWSRFGVFVAGPAAIIRYARGPAQARTVIGHNPLGALSVLAMLAFAFLQIATGLFSDDEIATTGPFAHFASSYWAAKATYFHTEIGKPVLIALVVLHVAAIAFYAMMRKNNLVPAMWHGDTEVADAMQASRDDGRPRILAAVIFVACACAVAGVVQWAG